MTRNTRIGLLVASAVVIIAAFVLLRPADDKKQDTTTATTVARTTTTPAGVVTTTRTVEAAKPDPGPLLTAAKVTKFSVNSGDTVRFRVRSKEPEEVHIHGYDIKKEIPGGKTVSISFPATIEGGFVIEFEQSATQIGQLSVEP